MLIAGTLLSERLYLGITILSISGESDSQYQDANNGYFEFKLLEGRNRGAVIYFGNRKTSLYGLYHDTIVSYTGLGSTPDQGRGEGYDGWRQSHNLGGNVYTLSIVDVATSIEANCQVTLTWGSGTVSYMGNTYGLNDTIRFDYSDLR